MTMVRKVGDDTIVNVTTAGTQFGGETATLSNGNYVVSWIDYGFGGGERAKGRVFASDGTAITGEFDLLLSYDVTELTTGGFLVVAPGYTRVGQVQMYAADGTPVGDVILTGSTNSSSQSAVGLIDGGFVFVETERGDNPSNLDDWGLFAQRFDSTGTKVGVRFAVNSDVVGDQFVGTTVALSGGGFAIMWTTNDPAADGSGTAVRAQVYDASGQRIGEEIAVNTTTAGDQFNADILALADGGFAVHYNTNDSGGQSQGTSYVQRFDAAGAKIGGERALNTPAGEFLRLSDGHVAHIYQLLETSEIFVQLFDNALNPLGGAFGFQGVSGFGSFNDAAAIAGGIVLTYSSPFNLDGSQGAVVMQRLELTETSTGTGRGDRLAAPNDNAWLANGGAGDDTLTGAGGNDRIVGGIGNDILRGGLGDNRLLGDAGDDVLLATGEGRNYMSGGTGNDRLVGSAGFELMIGGDGADSFAFRSGDVLNAVGAQDARIVDFSRAQGDRIDLSLIDARIGGGDDAFTFIGNTTFTGAGAELKIRYKDGFAFVDGDLDGDGRLDLVIKIDGATDLTAADFIL